MPPVPLLAADGDRANTGQQADAPQVVMQVLAADTDVLEWPLAGPDAVGKCPQPGERDSEGKPAEQRRLLSRTEFLVERTADRTRCCREVCHTAPLPTRLPGSIHRDQSRCWQDGRAAPAGRGDRWPG